MVIVEMLVNIIQGIVSAPSSPKSLSSDGNHITLNSQSEPIVITLADGNVNYLHTELDSIRNAWVGPFLPSVNYWLYWDINKVSAQRTFGSTPIKPTYGTVRPINPAPLQHFFDTSTNQMLVWSGNDWKQRLRVFAGEVQAGKLISYEAGSQILLNRKNTAGEIVFDDNFMPISGGGKFLTSETKVSASYNPANFFKLESTQIRSRSVENIPKFHAVTWKRPYRIGLAKQSAPLDGECVGIAVENMLRGDVKRFVTSGYITNESWNFATPGSRLYVGPTGEVTETAPQSVSMQIIGTVINPNTAFIDIRELVKFTGPTDAGGV